MPDVEEAVSIDSLAAGGDGVGRLTDGRVAFARLTAPGDRVHIVAPDSGARYVRARDVELLRESPERVRPECAAFGSCGGCAWQHIAYPIQVDAKRQILRDAIERIGRFREAPPISLVPSPSAYGYRGRTRLLLARGRVGYRRWRDREIEPIEKCPVLLPELESALGALASKLGASAPGSENPACESEWELAAGVGQRVRSVALGDDALEAASEQQWVELEAGESRIRISPGVFAQSNPLMYDILISQVTDALSGVRPGTMLELFAGAGFFTVGLARRFERVVAVESDTRATADLEHNLAVAGLRGVEVLTARAEQALAKLEQCRPDAVLLDPPRVGLARGAAQQLAELGAERIAYLSCDPATLARDLAVICTDPTTGASRYELSSLTGFDLFPQTPHVEALAVLDRAG